MKRPNPQDENSSIIAVNQLNILTNCIFALTMSVMFLFIEKPPTEMVKTEAAVQKYLLDQADIVAIALGTFMLLALYWVSNHHQEKYIRDTDTVHLWLTLAFLMCITLLPFPNSLTMIFQDSRSVQIVYSLDLFFIGFFSYLKWWHATKNHHLVDPDLDPEIIGKIKREALVEPGAALLSIGGAFINFSCWYGSFFLVPVIMIILKTPFGKTKP